MGSLFFLIIFSFLFFDVRIGPAIWAQILQLEFTGHKLTGYKLTGLSLNIFVLFFDRPTWTFFLFDCVKF